MNVIMPISNSQEGTITEGEFAKVVMVTSGGKAVPTRGLTDDEHRDFDIHLRRHLTDLAVQCKTSLVVRKHGRYPMLQITFRVRPPLFTSPQFYYFFAHFNTRSIAFTEPVFLVPSWFVHKHGRKGTGTRKGAIPFQFKASLGPNARDKWSPYQLTLPELGPRIVEILQELSRRQKSSGQVLQLFQGHDVIWVRKPAKVRRRQHRRAA